LALKRANLIHVNEERVPCQRENTFFGGPHICSIMRGDGLKIIIKRPLAPKQMHTEKRRQDIVNPHLKGDYVEHCDNDMVRSAP
jgi:hypothetical protein